jgi:Holliday junction resolvase RusA-like endonuclease
MLPLGAGERSLDFIVLGRPAPQGSKKGGATGQLREASVYLPAWRREITLCAQRARIAAGWVKAEGPCRLDVVFYIERAANPVPHAQVYPAVKPDNDKLARAVADALTSAGVWRDDCLWVDTGRLAKRYAGETDALLPNNQTGAWIRVTELS